jgi:hypothetical protein
MARENPKNQMKHRDSLQKQYLDYFELITGLCPIERSPLVSTVQLESRNALSLYQSDYLKEQILNWGGVIEEIFSETCRILKEEEISLEKFVPFFHSTPLPIENRYDFFLIKLDRFKNFVSEISTEISPAARSKLLSALEEEHQSCRNGYLFFNPAD